MPATFASIHSIHGRFPLGRLVMTPGARDLMLATALSPFTLLERHKNGDWGDVDTDDAKANDAALARGGRLFSAYRLGDQCLWIITESNRHSTCILLPSEY